MHGVRQRTIWMILDHPHQLAIALPLVSCWRENGYIVNLLISPQSYWRYVDINAYAGRFNRIIRFGKRPDFVSSIHRVIQQIYDILSLKKQVMKLGIMPDDIIIGLSASTFLENIVLSCTPKNKRITIIPEAEYYAQLRRPDWSTFRFSRAGWLSRYLVQPLTGLERVLRLTQQEPQLNVYGGADAERFEREIGDIYNKVVVLVNLYDGFRVSDSKTTFMPYPYILELEDIGEQAGRDEDRKKSIVFFGTEFAVEGIQPSNSIEFATTVNQCLSFLRRIYGDTHRLVYKPHPHETEKEWSLLDLSQFELQTDKQLAEFYMFDHRDTIDAVFSVHSTASRSAANFGINAYVFFELFGFDDLTKQYNHRHLGKQPDSFYIRDLSIPPTKYQDPQRLECARMFLREVISLIIEEVP